MKWNGINIKPSIHFALNLDQMYYIYVRSVVVLQRLIKGLRGDSAAVPVSVADNLSHLLCIDPISVAFGLRNHQNPKCFGAFIHELMWHVSRYMTTAT